MALYASWAAAPKYITEEGVVKNRFTVYPVIEGGVEGHADFIEKTETTTTRADALTVGACQDQLAVIDLLAFFEADDLNTTGRYTLNSRITNDCTFDQTVVKVTQKMDNWEAGPPPST